MSPLLDLLITLLHWGAAGWRDALARREALYGHACAALQNFAAAHGERVLETTGNPISLALTLASFDAAEPAAVGTVAGAAGEAAEQELQQQQETAEEKKQQQVAAEQQPPAVGSAKAAEEQQQEQEQQAAASSSGQQASSDGQQTPAAASPLGITFLGSMLFGRCVSGTRVVARGKRQDVGGLQFTGYGAHCDAYPCDYLTVAAALGTSEGDVDAFLARLEVCFAEFRRRRQRQRQGRGRRGTEEAAGPNA